jgi:MFS family permease
MAEANKPWYRELNRYHWFVLIVCTLGWCFDCFNQQMFALNRKPAVTGLLGVASGDPLVERFSTMATSVLLIGWATGGLIFGVLGDRIGRAKTMVMTILIYSTFTGLISLSQTVYDFMLYQFLTGLGVGGQFAVGVALVAETMPDRARPYALGMLQGFANLANVCAALVGMGFGQLRNAGVLSEQATWRTMFSIGILPALLAVLVMRRLKEPERWQKAVAEGAKRKGGSMKELFSDPRWRKNAIVGLLLATSGVIGLWGIGFFSFDLNQSVFRKNYQQEARDAGDAEKDRQLVAAIIRSPECFDKVEKGEEKLDPKGLLTLDVKVDPKNADPLALYDAALRLRSEKKDVSVAAVLDVLDQRSEGREAQKAVEERQRRSEYLEGAAASAAECPQHVARINARQKQIDGDVRWWGSITSILFNIGGFFGVYVFSRVTQRIGRKPAFAISFVLAAAATSAAFLYMSEPWQVYWMVPTMGFCIFLLFGGYAIYFAELFPTRLRSTGTSFCYNIGRYLSAVGVWGLGLLTSVVYAAEAEPLRYAGVTMCACFLVGLVALFFAPETKGKPLPE